VVNIVHSEVSLGEIPIPMMRRFKDFVDSFSLVFMELMNLFVVEALPKGVFTGDCPIIVELATAEVE